MDRAMDLGADYLATGHYAQILWNPGANRHELCRGADPNKDQSYFLFTMREQDLSRTLFPIGTFQKNQVRDLAEKLGLLNVAKKPDSQEICFVQGRTYKEFIESRVPASMLKAGKICTSVVKRWVSTPAPPIHNWPTQGPRCCHAKHFRRCAFCRRSKHREQHRASGSRDRAF
jgi:tRNA-specific 2-thiouridylase